MAESAGGSFLPVKSTEVFFQKGFYVAEFERIEDPAFIPYNSALDVVNGQSRFTPPTIQADRPGYHDVVPPEVAELLLVRLGYPHVPLAASISGPSTIPYNQTRTWEGVVSGSGTGATGHRWDYSNTSCGGIDPELTSGEPTVSAFGDGDAPADGPILPGDGPPTTDGLPCGEWYFAYAGRVFSYSLPPGQFQLRLTATRGNETAVAYHRVYSGSTGGGGGGGDLEARSGGGADAAKAALSSVQTAGMPESYALHPAAPNPSHGRATVAFDLPEATEVRLVVVDVLGREVSVLAEGSMAAGAHRAVWEASGLPAGLYLVRIQAGAFAATRPLTLAR